MRRFLFWPMLLLLASRHFLQKSSALKTSNADISALESLYNSTNGAKWDFGEMGCSQRKDRAGYANFGVFASNFSGSAWNFSRNSSSGLYTTDPCDVPINVSSSGHWAALSCNCTSSSCEINGLFMSCGNLRGNIAPELFSLTSLRLLGLDSNSLTGHIPPSLCNLTRLTFLDLKFNSLVGTIPRNISLLSKLQALTLFENSLVGSIPSDIGNIKPLQVLQLYSNGLTGKIPASINLLTKLSKIDVYQNRLTGNIPYLGSLKALQFIGLANNYFTGAIPQFFGTLKQLRYLFLGDNYFSGDFPDFIGELNELIYLSCSDMSFSPGPIPPGFSNLTKMQHLDLAQSNRTGPIPTFLGNWTSMEVLKLATNSLTGIVPMSLRNMVNLTTLELGDNNLISDPNTPGSISFIDPTTQTKLRILDLGNNAFSGQIDDRLFTMSSLRTLAMHSNCFQGQLPENICRLTGLSVLILSDLSGGSCHKKYIWRDTIFKDIFNAFTVDNMMEGVIPECIFNGMPKLQAVLISGNNFQGQIPIDMSPSIDFLDVSHNSMIGELAAATANSNFTFMDVSFNRFNGTLDIFKNQDMSSSEDLRLEVNRFSGDVPASLKNVERINILTGNVFSCTGSKNSLPRNDPNNLQYQCGSNTYNNSIIVFCVCIVIVSGMLTWTYCSSGSSHFYISEIRQWMRPFYGTETETGTDTGTEIGTEDATADAIPVEDIEELNVSFDTLVSREISSYPNLVHYGREIEHFRGVVKKIGIFIFIVFFVTYSSFQEQYRTVGNVYGWVTTAAYLMGPVPGTTLLVLGLLFMYIMRYIMLYRSTGSITKEEIEMKTIAQSRQKLNTPDIPNTKDTKESDVNNDINNKSPSPNMASYSPSPNKYLIPLLRLLVIFVLKLGLAIIANSVFLYVSFNYSEILQALATIALGVFNFVWGFIFKRLCSTPKLYFGLTREEHNKFITRFLGNEIYFLFIASSLSTFWTMFFSAAAVEPSCLKNLFIASPVVRAQYTINDCVEFLLDGTCAKFNHKSTKININSPFIYEYTCGSTLLRAYIPVYIAQYLVISIISVIQFYYLWWYTTNESWLEKDTSFCFWLLNWPKRLFMESLLLNSYNKRENMYKDNIATNHKNINNVDNYFARKENKYYSVKKVDLLSSAYTYVMTEHMTGLLVLVTIGVFAPLLAFVTSLTLYFRLFVNELVLGRCLYIEAAISALYKKRVLNAGKYVVKLEQGTSLRLYPDFASKKLRTVAYGEMLLIDISNAEKPSDSESALVYVKVVGEAGWVPFNAIDIDINIDINIDIQRGETGIEIGERDSSIIIGRDSSLVGRTCSTIGLQQSLYSKRRLGLLITYKVGMAVDSNDDGDTNNANSAFVLTEPSHRAARIRTLHSGTTVELDMSDRVEVENSTFVRLGGGGGGGWVALEGLEKVSVNRTDGSPAKIEDYPQLGLQLWLKGQSVDSIEKMIRNSESPWGSVNFLQTLEHECSNVPDSTVKLGLRTYLIAFSLTAAIILNDIFNNNSSLLVKGRTKSSYFVPAEFFIVFAVPAFELLPYIQVAWERWGVGGTSWGRERGDGEMGGKWERDSKDMRDIESEIEMEYLNLGSTNNVMPIHRDVMSESVTRNPMMVACAEHDETKL